MLSLETQVYLDLARETAVFKESELAVLEEVLGDYLNFPSEGYVIFDERMNGEIVGFIIFGRTPLTLFGWDIFWMAVARGHQGKGFGKRLIRRVEQYVLQCHPRAFLRVETSSQESHAHALNLYLRMGFKEAGRIYDYYTEGDHNIILYKALREVSPKEVKEMAGCVE